MQYLCVKCDERFEAAEGDRPRCPRCMRVHGLRPVDAEASPEPDGRRRMLWLAALVAVAAAVLVVTRYRSADPAAGAPGAGARSAAGALSGVAGADATLLEPTDAVRSWVRQVAGGATDPQARAHAVVKAIRARAQERAFVPWSMTDPRQGPEPMLPDAVLEALARDDGRARLYPLEAAALAVAALRALDVGAFVGAVRAFPTQQTPPDPSGRVGYFGVVVRDTHGEHWYDPYGGRSAEPAADARKALDDGQAVGALLAIRALHALAGAEDAAALRLSERALTLWPDSTSARGARAAVLLGTGGVPDGERELQAAAQLFPGPAQHNNLAMLRLAQGDVDAASKLVARALEATPEYAAALVTLANLHLAGMERDLARAALERAERLDPENAALEVAWAQYYAAAGELEPAILHAQRAVKLRPKNPQSHVMLGRIYREAGRYDDMRASARQALASAPPAQREGLRKLIEQLLGPTALLEEPAPGAVAAPDAAPGPAEPGSFDLGSGSPTGSPSGLQEPGGLNLGDPDMKLQLGGSDSSLKLKLGE